jgi:hypothetical protein
MVNTTTIYAAPWSIVPPAVSFLFSVPNNDPIMLPVSFAMANWFVSAPSASLRAFKDSHSSSVKSKTAATAFLFKIADVLIVVLGVGGAGRAKVMMLSSLFFSYTSPPFLPPPYCLLPIVIVSIFLSSSLPRHRHQLVFHRSC